MNFNIGDRFRCEYKILAKEFLKEIFPNTYPEIITDREATHTNDDWINALKFDECEYMFPEGFVIVKAQMENAKYVGMN